MIRLSTAHAKARLSPLVEKKDAEAAVELVDYSIFREIVEPKKDDPPKSKKAKTRDESESEDDDEEEEEVIRPRYSSS